MGRKRNPRPAGWGKDLVLAELGVGRTLSEIYEKWAHSGATVNGLKWDVRKWKRDDDEFAAEVDRLVDARKDPRVETLRKAPPPPTKEERDPSIANWRVQYCADLLETGTRTAAAERSPYDYSHIYRMLEPRYKDYDEEFAELVHETEMRICAEMEGGIVEAFREADRPKDKAWIAKSWLERRDPTRWSRQVEMIHSGEVKHKHKHELPEPIQERLEALLDEQRKFFEESEARLQADGVIEADFVVVDSQPLQVQSA